MVEFSWNSRSTSMSKLHVVIHQVMPPTTLSKGDSPLMRALKYPAASNNSRISVSLTFCSSSSRVSTYKHVNTHSQYPCYMITWTYAVSFIKNKKAGKNPVKIPTYKRS
uniref:Uncharacterized protein n=1 Tax=Anguilla anguilla TaxID=7936 RepID=A0A0E9RAA2_ANGAN